jgi:hypothetical protein
MQASWLVLPKWMQPESSMTVSKIREIAKFCHVYGAVLNCHPSGYSQISESKYFIAMLNFMAQTTAGKSQMQLLLQIRSEKSAHEWPKTTVTLKVHFSLFFIFCLN